MTRQTIKLYQRTYTLPVLTGGELDNLQSSIQSSSQALRQGYRIVVKVTEEKKGWLIWQKKEKVRQEVRESLTFEERYVELDNLVKNYDRMIETLTAHQGEYQQFFYGVAEEIKSIVTNKCLDIAAVERKRQQLEITAQGNNDDDLFQLTVRQKDQLRQTARTVGFAAILMLKKLELMSQCLEKIANDKETQRQVLASMAKKLGLQRQAYELQLEINRLQAEAAEMAKVALNFEEYMKQFLGSFQALLANVSQVDGELAGAARQIQEIANLMVNDQPNNLPMGDQESEKILDFLLAGQMSKDRLPDALERSRQANSEVEFDLKVEVIALEEVSIESCLENIQTYVNFHLDPVLQATEEKKKKNSNTKLNITKKAQQYGHTEASKRIAEIKEKRLNNESAPLKPLLLPELVRVQGGNFKMGSPVGVGYENQHPQRELTIRDFSMGVTQVTVTQYLSVMDEPSGFVYLGNEFKGKNQPMVRVSWDEAKEYCRRLSQLTGQNFRLPSEAEWEYTARGGNQSKGYNYAGSNNLDEVGWYEGNSGGKTHPVEQKKANELGIYDMSGNVYEWCDDVWHDNYQDAPTDGLSWITGGGANYRVLRGGSWDECDIVCRVANRYYYPPDYRSNFIGFRVAVS